MNNTVLIKEDPPGQMAHFMTLFHIHTIMMAFATLIKLQITKKQYHFDKQGAQFMRAVCYHLLC